MIVTQTRTTTSEITNNKEFEKTNGTTKKTLPSEIGTDYSYKRKIIWRYALGNAIVHLGALYGLYLVPQAYFKTLVWSKLKFDPVLLLNNSFP